MKVVKHCFVSEKGELLPRWQEAFPTAEAISYGQKIDPKQLQKNPPSLIWLRPLAGRPVADSLAEIRNLLGGVNEVPFIVLSDAPQDEEALACFSAAAKGYCNTHAAPKALQQVADVVLQGGLWIGETLMQRLVQATVSIPNITKIETTENWAAKLTEREQQVARVVAGGASNKEIAKELGITERTVKLHVGAVLSKLGVRDRLQLSLIVNGSRVGL